MTGNNYSVKYLYFLESVFREIALRLGEPSENREPAPTPDYSITFASLVISCILTALQSIKAQQRKFESRVKDWGNNKVARASQSLL